MEQTDAAGNILAVYSEDQRLVLSDLFRSHYGRMVGVARLLLDRTEESEEVVQEAFLRLDRKWETIAPNEGSRVAYLRTTVLNLSRSRLRRRYTARRHPPTPEPPAPPAEDHAVGRDVAAHVRAALSTLSRRQRECVVLKYYADLRDREIAEQLGISAGAVKSHLHRASKHLAVELEELT